MLLASMEIELPTFVSLPALELMSGTPSRLPKIARPKSNLPNDNQTEEDADQ
jgi:hypothetical protein